MGENSKWTLLWYIKNIRSANLWKEYYKHARFEMKETFDVLFLEWGHHHNR